MRFRSKSIAEKMVHQLDGQSYRSPKPCQVLEIGDVNMPVFFRREVRGDVLFV